MADCPELLVSEPDVSPRRRFRPRQTLRSLAYVKLDEENGGIIRDLTEAGMAIHSVAPLRPEQDLNLRFELLAPRLRVDARARVVWADSGGQAGIQLLGLSSRTQRALRDWLLIQMLAAAAIPGRDSMFSLTPPVRELAFSAAARPTILTHAAISPSADDFDLARVRWGMFSLSIPRFSLLVDALVLVCAALLFAISAVAVMGGLPDWPLAATFFVTASTIFAAVYQIVFSDLFCGGTPGRRLAQMATSQADYESELQRFR